MKKNLSKDKIRNLTNQAVYISLNVGFAVGVWVLLAVFSSPALAIVLLLLSKWRVLAVKPRFWWANIQSNAVDFMVGLSYVTWLSQASQSVVPQVIIFVAYLTWLLIIKPRASKKMVASQGLIALFFGISSLLMVSYEWNDFFVILVELLICFVTGRHILSAYNVKNVSYYAGIWALISGELLWILNHWVVAYRSPLSGIYLVQPAIIIALANLAISLLVDDYFVGLDKHESGKKAISTRNILPIILCFVTIALLLIFMSQPLIGAI